MAGLRDTSAYSAYLRGHDELRARLQQLDRIVVTPIVLGELDAGFRAGCQRKQSEAELRRFLASPRLRWFRWTRRPPSATARSCTPCGPPARPFPPTTSGSPPRPCSMGSASSRRTPTTTASRRSSWSSLGTGDGTRRRALAFVQHFGEVLRQVDHERSDSRFAKPGNGLSEDLGALVPGAPALDHPSLEVHDPVLRHALPARGDFASSRERVSRSATPSRSAHVPSSLGSRRAPCARSTPTTSRHCRSDVSPPRRNHSSFRTTVCSAVSTRTTAAGSAPRGTGRPLATRCASKGSVPTTKKPTFTPLARCTALNEPPFAMASRAASSLTYQSPPSAFTRGPAWGNRRSATTSMSSFDRGSPCSELAKEPAVTYATPRRSRMPATATATRSGSGSPSGAIGRPPPVRAARGLGAQAQRREPQQQLSLVRPGMAGPQAGEGQRARGAGEVDDPGRLLGQRHARIPLKAERVDVGRRIGRASRVGHTAICGHGREPAKTRGVPRGALRGVRRRRRPRMRAQLERTPESGSEDAP